MQAGSLVNGGLLKSSLTRFWPLWLIDMAAWGLFYLAPLAATLSAASPEFMAMEQVLESRMELWGAFLYLVLPIAFTGAIIVAVYLNERLFSAQAATFYGSLPVGRRTLFATSVVAGLLPQLLVEAVAALFLLALCVSMEGLAPALALQWLAFAAGVTFVMYALALVACHVSGSRPVAVLLYILANVLAVCIAVAVALVASALMYGMTLDTLPLEWASPLVGIGAHCLNLGSGTPAAQVGWPALAAYCLAGVALVALAAWLDGRRDLERAGDAVAFDGLKPVLKYLAGICGALLMGAFVYLCLWLSGQGFRVVLDAAGAAVMAACMGVGAFAGVLFAQMAIAKSTHVLKSTWKGGAVLAALAVVLVAACHVDALGIANAVPEVAEVESVELLADYSPAGTFTSDGGIESVRSLHRQALEYGEDLKNGSASLDVRNEDAGAYSTIGMVYHLKNGQMMERFYPVGYLVGEDGSPVDSAGVELLRSALAVANGQEAKLPRLAWLLDESSESYCEKFQVTVWHDEYNEEGSESIVLGGKQAADFAENALVPDVLEGGVDDIGFFWGTVESRMYDASIEVTDERGDRLFSYQLGAVSSPHTIAWVEKNLPDVKLGSWDADDGSLVGEQTMAD